MEQERSKEILKQYGIGPIQFSGSNDALYERHLTFDHVVDVKKAGLQEQYEASARAIRDIISQPAEQVAGSQGWYDPRWHYQNETETRAALDMIMSNYFSRNEPGVRAAEPHVAHGWGPLYASGAPHVLP